jgi:hypothetical protein
MKIKYTLSLLAIALALVGSGCAASARIGNVSTDLPADVRVALVSKEAR